MPDKLRQCGVEGINVYFNENAIAKVYSVKINICSPNDIFFIEWVMYGQ